MKVMIRKDVFNSLDLSWLSYHMWEGFGVDFESYRVKDNHVNLYFKCEFKKQRQVVQALQFLGVDTGR